jgi:nucleoside-diphosphate-sugar epimerase
MRVLVIGGSGYVGSLIAPSLAAHHAIRVLDLRPPSIACEYIPGDATEYATLAGAMNGVDVLLHCAMGAAPDDTPQRAVLAFDVNVKSVYLALRAAHEAGVPHAVHMSSMSVYRNLLSRRIDDESTPPDAHEVYGLTKRLGEEVCRAAVAEWGLSVTVLRLTWPTPDADWPAWGAERPPVRLRAANGEPVQATAASDLSRAVLAALERRGGFEVFTISGDRSARLWSIARAQDVLAWSPTFE